MLNRNFKTAVADEFDNEPALPTHDSVPLSVVIATDHPANAQALVAACELMSAFACRVRVASLHGDPARLRARPDEILIVDLANAFDSRLDPSRYPASPCISIVHAADSHSVDLAHTHAALRFADLTPAALELAVRLAQNNCRSTMIARRAAEAAERAAVAAREAQSRALEEISPSAHALQGLLEIMSADADAPNGQATAQFKLLQKWARDLIGAVGRHQDAVAAISAETDLTAIVEDAIALLKAKSDGLGHTVVFSAPGEPVLTPVDAQRLQAAVRQLIECALDREGSARRIDIVLWQSMEDVRLALVSGPPARRGLESDENCAPPPVRAAGLPDAGYVGALALLRELGATIEAKCADASGASLLISMPLA